MSTWMSEWMALGRPSVVNDATRKVAKGVDLIYVLTDNGGSAHIVFDDGNYDDHSIDFCLAIEGWGNFTKEHIEFVREVLLAFKALSIEERWSAMAIQGSQVEHYTGVQDEDMKIWKDTIFVDELAPVYDMGIDEIRKLWESL